MFEILEKMLLAGSGLMTLSREKAEELVDALIAKGQLDAKDKNAIVNKLLKKTKQLDKDMEGKIKTVALDLVKNTQSQINALNKKLEKLAKDLEAEKKKKKK